SLYETPAPSCPPLRLEEDLCGGAPKRLREAPQAGADPALDQFARPSTERRSTFLPAHVSANRQMCILMSSYKLGSWVRRGIMVAARATDLGPRGCRADPDASGPGPGGAAARCFGLMTVAVS